MTARMTGPRRLPTWTVPDGVFESLTTCGPLTRAASSSAQSIRCASTTGPPRAIARAPRGPRRSSATPSARGSGDADDLVGEVAGRDLHDDLLALLLAEQRPTDRALVRDPALRRLGLGRTDDREGFRAIGALDADGRADLDV